MALGGIYDHEGLVPKLGLGTPLPAKLSLATILVPKCNLGTRGMM
jgi:hypothetical protein